MNSFFFVGSRIANNAIVPKIDYRYFKYIFTLLYRLTDIEAITFLQYTSTNIQKHLLQYDNHSSFSPITKLPYLLITHSKSYHINPFVHFRQSPTPTCQTH